MDLEYLNLLKRNIANVSIGPSTARGMGPKGTVKAARDFLAGLDLSRFSNEDQAEFQQRHDKNTEDLKRKLPEGGRYWGSARKFLNIFLRNALYNQYLCSHYHLNCLEPWLELPLDSHVAKGLMAEQGSEHLPRWRSIIGLSPKVHKAYQDFALRIASFRKTCRVHLDILYWRATPKGNHL